MKDRRAKQKQKAFDLLISIPIVYSDPMAQMGVVSKRMRQEEETNEEKKREFAVYNGRTFTREEEQERRERNEILKDGFGLQRVLKLIE